MAQMYKVFHNLQTIIFDEDFPEITSPQHNTITLSSCDLKNGIHDIRQHLTPAMRSTLQIQDPGFEVYKRLKEPFYYPIVAAGGLIKNLKGELLMIKRHNMWDLPKGKAESHESHLTCALREVEEETGVTCRATNNTPFQTQHIYQRDNKWHLKTTYWFRMEPSQPYTLLPQTDEGITEVCWMPVDAMHKIDHKDIWPMILEVIGNLVG